MPKNIKETYYDFLHYEIISTVLAALFFAALIYIYYQGININYIKESFQKNYHEIRLRKKKKGSMNAFFESIYRIATSFIVFAIFLSFAMFALLQLTYATPLLVLDMKDGIQHEVIHVKDKNYFECDEEITGICGEIVFTSVEGEKKNCLFYHNDAHYLFSVGQNVNTYYLKNSCIILNEPLW